MAINYQSDSVLHQPSRMVPLLMAVNIALAAAVLGGWTYVAQFAAEPVAWATWVHVYRTGEIRELFDYPYVMLWGLPLGAICISWLLEKSGSRSMSFAWLMLPIVLNAMVLGWFYLAPYDWR